MSAAQQVAFTQSFAGEHAVGGVRSPEVQRAWFGRLSGSSPESTWLFAPTTDACRPAWFFGYTMSGEEVRDG